MTRAYYDSRNQGSLVRLVPDLIRARELLLSLVSKDLRAQYRFAVIGYLWAIIEPLAMTLVLTFVFYFVFQLDMGEDKSLGENVVLLLCGYLFWRFFTDSVSAGTRSLVENASLVNKVNFPREIVPLAVVGRCLVNLAIGFVIFLAIHLAFGGAVSLSYLWTPVVFAILLALTAGLTLLCASLYATFRDVGYIVNLAMIFGFYATPIFYRVSMVQEVADRKDMPWLVTLFRLNPMVGIIEALRATLVLDQQPDLPALLWPSLFAALALAVGVITFRKRSATITDHM